MGNYQKILVDGANKAAKSHTDMFKKDEAKLISFFKNKGLTITYPDLVPFRAALKPVHNEYIEKNKELGQKLFDAIDSAR